VLVNFLNYYQDLAKTDTCPGIGNNRIYTLRGVDPEEDIRRCVTFRRWFDYPCIVLWYKTAEGLDRWTRHFNRDVEYTDTWCLFMDPHNPTDPNILQPPAPCVIIQSYSQLQNMRSNT